METEAAPTQLPVGPVVLYDGVCNFCNGTVNFIIDHEAKGKVRFAAQQSELGQRILRHHNKPTESLSTLYLLEDNKLYHASEAALRIARYLDGPWALAQHLRLVPRPVRDAVYYSIARNRYALFGKRETCRLPTPEVRSRFLDAATPTVA